MKNLSTIFVTLVLMFALINSAFPQDWNIPSTAKKKLNPHELNKENISVGKKVYQVNCKSCHGEPTKNNMLPLVPTPTDLGTQNFLVQSDGEIYYKLKTGKGAMPTFEKTLSDDDKWMVIAYLRSFDKNKKTTLVSQAVVNPEVTDLKISLNVDPEHKKLKTQLTGLKKDGKCVGLEGVELSFLVKRTFGQLDISGDEAYTDANGELEIQFPVDLPGNRDGQIDLTVKVTNEDDYGIIEEKRTLSIAVPTNPENILNQRTMWGTRANAPIWLVVTYVLGVIGVWAVIFIVLFQLLQLSKMRKSK